MRKLATFVSSLFDGSSRLKVIRGAKKCQRRGRLQVKNAIRLTWDESVSLSEVLALSLLCSRSDQVCPQSELMNGAGRGSSALSAALCPLARRAAPETPEELRLLPKLELWRSARFSRFSSLWRTFDLFSYFHQRAFACVVPINNLRIHL